MDYIENDNDHIGGTTQQLRNAIEQSVRGWISTTSEFHYDSTNARAEVIEDLTQHLFGNVVMALRFALKTDHDGPHEYRYGFMNGCSIC